MRLFIAWCWLATLGAADFPAIRLEPLWTAITFEQPLCVVHANDGSPRLFVAERGGRVWAVPTDPHAAKPALFLDLRDRVLTKGVEEGLLAIVFHPHYPETGQFFVYWSRSAPRRTVLSRFHVDPTDPQRIDPASEETVLEIAQPYENHNGSSLVFGPDGYLYLGPGDGGAAGDPHDNAQNLGVLLGKILRLDIDHRAPGLAYGIPTDNPFVGTAGARGEIWAYGMRNPWRMTFDRQTGELWAGDVGQNTWEEVDLIVKGGNYGWRIREGTHPFHDQTHTAELIEPVFDYGRDIGASVTGGYVYRGARIAGLQGAYLYADYATGRLLALRYEGGKVVAQRRLLDTRINLPSFGELPDGELLVCGFDGRVYAIVPGN